MLLFLMFFEASFSLNYVWSRILEIVLFENENSLNLASYEANTKRKNKVVAHLLLAIPQLIAGFIDFLFHMNDEPTIYISIVFGYLFAGMMVCFHSTTSTDLQFFTKAVQNMYSFKRRFLGFLTDERRKMLIFRLLLALPLILVVIELISSNKGLFMNSLRFFYAFLSTLSMMLLSDPSSNSNPELPIQTEGNNPTSSSTSDSTSVNQTNVAGTSGLNATSDQSDIMIETLSTNVQNTDSSSPQQTTTQTNEEAPAWYIAHMKQLEENCVRRLSSKMDRTLEEIKETSKNDGLELETRLGDLIASRISETENKLNNNIYEVLIRLEKMLGEAVRILRETYHGSRLIEHIPGRSSYVPDQFIKEQSDGISNLGKEIRYFFWQVLNIVEEKSSLIISNNNSGTSYLKEDLVQVGLHFEKKIDEASEKLKSTITDIELFELLMTFVSELEYKNKQNLSEFTTIAAEIFKALDILKENYLELVSSPQNFEIWKITREIHKNQTKIVNEIEKIPEKMHLPILKLAKELVNSKGCDVNMSDDIEEKQLPSGSSESDEHQESNEFNKRQRNIYQYHENNPEQNGQAITTGQEIKGYYGTNEKEMSRVYETDNFTSNDEYCDSEPYDSYSYSGSEYSEYDSGSESDSCPENDENGKDNTEEEDKKFDYEKQAKCYDSNAQEIENVLNINYLTNINEFSESEYSESHSGSDPYLRNDENGEDNDQEESKIIFNSDNVNDADENSANDQENEENGISETNASAEPKEMQNENGINKESSNTTSVEENDFIISPRLAPNPMEFSVSDESFEMLNPEDCNLSPPAP